MYGDNEELEDKIVPIKECDSLKYSDAWTAGNIMYCPDFNDDHFFYGDYYSDFKSYYKLIIH